MRGDGPANDGTAAYDLMAAPHARGWTRRLAPKHTLGVGCPACAGMDPFVATQFSDPDRLPRTRGWTWKDATAGRHLSGCPACAGMDPGWRRQDKGPRGLPRMRGDGPYVAGQEDIVERAARHARGWTRDRWLCSPRGSWLPRMRGDGPPAGMDPSRRVHTIDLIWAAPMRGANHAS